MFQKLASSAFILTALTVGVVSLTSPVFAADHRGGGRSSGSRGNGGGSSRSYASPSRSYGGRVYSEPRVYSAPRVYRAPAYRGGVSLGFGGGYRYGGYPYGYNYYAPTYTYVAPVPACARPYYDRYGNLIQDPACYANQPYPTQQYSQQPQYQQPQPQYNQQQPQYQDQQQYDQQQQQYNQQQPQYQDQPAPPYSGR